MFATSCIDDNEEVNNPSPENVLTLDSNLVNLLLNVAINDGSFDNIIDNASCISLELPVTVIIDETEIVVNSETDFDAIEAIFDMFQTDDDTLEIVFPITVILSDYTQVVINSAEELAGYVAECFGENEDDDDIECIDFQYPIVFSTYDSNFQIIDTVSIENDEALYAFINNLEAGVLASLNFPVTLELANGETIEVNNNEELETAISEAENDCDEDDDNDWNDDDYDCSLETINELLLNCTFETTIYNENDELIDTYQLDFNIENELIVNGELTVPDEAFWTLTEVESGYQIHIEDTPNFNLIDGDWIIESCAEDQLIMNQQTDSGNRKAVLEQECDNPFECFENTTLTACDFDDDSYASFDLEAAYEDCLNSDFDVTYHETLEGAQTGVNNLSSPHINTVSNQQTLYVRVELMANGQYNTYELTLIVEDCENPFECFNESSNQSLACDEENSSAIGIPTYNLTQIFSDCNSSDVVVWYYETEADANTSVNAISNPSEYVNDSNLEVVFIRVELINTPGEYSLYEVNLEECNSNCSEAEVDAYLIECIWNVVNFNGSDDLINYNFDFESNSNIVVIYSETETIDAFWSTSQTNDGVFVEFSNVNGGNIQAVSGNWLIVECENDRLEMVKGEDIMVMEQNCE
jgi:hypothetical protein